MKQSMGNNPHPSILIFQVLSRFRKWRVFFNRGNGLWRLLKIIWCWIKINPNIPLVGDLVFLKLQPYKNTSLKVEGHQKITPKFYGPYQILQCIGTMAYKLALLASSKIHTVFHVSCLKKVVGPNHQVQSTLPDMTEEGSIWIHPMTILQTRECQLHNRTIKEVLVQWKDTPPKDVTWEPASILQQFIHLQP